MEVRLWIMKVKGQTKNKKDKTEQVLKFRISLARGARYKVTDVWEKRQQTSKITDFRRNIGKFLLKYIWRHTPEN